MQTTHAQELDLPRLRSALAGSGVGHTIRYVPVVDSTNQMMRSGPAEMRVHGSVVLAEYQSDGRGRRGRRWAAPYASSILMSVSLGWPRDAKPGDFSMLAAVATRDAIRDTTGLAPDLKWPNDVLLSGRKVCGILAEGNPRVGVVLGVGVNVNFDPSAHVALGMHSTSLAAELKRPVSREGLIVALCCSLDLWYGTLVQNPDSVFASWSASLKTVGSTVVVEDSSGTWRGNASDVRRDGGLVVRAEDGKAHTVYAADVSIRDFTAP